MSVSQVLSKLKSILEKIEKLDAEVKMAYPTDVQWVDLNNLCSNLSKAMARLQGKFKSLEKSQKEKTQEESKTFLSNMKSSVKNLFVDGELQYPSLFEKNIIKIFYDEDSSQRVPTPKRLGSTRQRCEKIRNLSPDGVITWAIAVAPSYWVGGSMSSNVFEYLLRNVEPELAQTWPSSIQETLYMLRKDESLQKSPGYKKFLEGLSALSDSYRRN